MTQHPDPHASTSHSPNPTPRPSTFLGIDYGTKRIGLAIGDDERRLATPVTTVTARGTVDEHVDAILNDAQEYAVDAFVIGLPLNMDDSEGEQAKLTRGFGDKLARRTGKPVHYFDERLSSRTARELLLPARLTRKKRKAVQDAVAAAVMLQEFLTGLDDT